MAVVGPQVMDHDPGALGDSLDDYSVENDPPIAGYEGNTYSEQLTKADEALKSKQQDARLEWEARTSKE